jgi:hypothetical protein
MGDNSAGSNIWGYDTRVLSATLNKPYVDWIAFPSPLPFRTAKYIAISNATPGNYGYSALCASNGEVLAIVDGPAFWEADNWSGATTLRKFRSPIVYPSPNWVEYLGTTSFTLPADVIGPASWVVDQTFEMPSIGAFERSRMTPVVSNSPVSLNEFLDITDPDEQAYGYLITVDWAGIESSDFDDSIYWYDPYAENEGKPEPSFPTFVRPEAGKILERAVVAYRYVYTETQEEAEADGRSFRKFEYIEEPDQQTIAEQVAQAKLEINQKVDELRDYVMYAYYYSTWYDNGKVGQSPNPGRYDSLLSSFTSYWTSSQVALEAHRAAFWLDAHEKVAPTLLNDPGVEPVLPVIWDALLKTHAPFSSYVGRKYELVETVTNSIESDTFWYKARTRNVTWSYQYDTVDQNGAPTVETVEYSFSGSYTAVTTDHGKNVYTTHYTFTDWYSYTDGGSALPVSDIPIMAHYNKQIRRYIPNNNGALSNNPYPQLDYWGGLLDTPLGLCTVYNGTTTSLMADYSHVGYVPDSRYSAYPYPRAAMVGNGSLMGLNPLIDMSAAHIPLQASIPNFIKQYRLRVPMVYTEGVQSRSRTSESHLPENSQVDIVFFGPHGKGIFGEWSPDDLFVDVFGYLTLLWDYENMVFRYHSWTPVRGGNGEFLDAINGPHGPLPAPKTIPRGSYEAWSMVANHTKVDYYRFYNEKRSPNVLVVYRPPKWPQIRKYTKQQRAQWYKNSQVPYNEQNAAAEILKAAGL